MTRRITLALARLLFLVLCAGSELTILNAQTVTVPSANPDEWSDRKPFGTFYGYERTQALYLASEIGTAGYVTKMGFYLNSVSNPSESTPVVIRLKNSTAAALNASAYSDVSSGATTVWSGNLTTDQLVPGSWTTVVFTTAFNYTGDNLEVFVETNYGTYGDEGFYGKQFRHSDPGSQFCQTWEDDLLPPTESGVLTSFRPNIQLTFEPACSGTPVPGSTLASVNTACTGEPFTLSMSGIGSGGGYTYDWQSSTDGISFNSISGANGPTLITSQTTALFYWCRVTCTLSGITVSSVSLQVTMSPYYQCYCASYAITSEDTKIDSFSLATLKSGSDSLACEGYTDYTALSTSLTPGQPYTLQIENGSCTNEHYASYVAVFIDYDHDAVFEDNNERVYTYGPIDHLNGIPDFTFFVPLNVQPGVTGMRVILMEGLEVPSGCSVFTRGETEDYLVNINTLTACSGTPVLGATQSTKNPVCSGESITLSLASYPPGSGITYQWQWSTDALGWNSFTGATSFTHSTTQTANRYYRCQVKCSGTNTTNSSALFVPLAPFYECYCTSSPLLNDDTKLDTVMLANVVNGSDPQHCEGYSDYSAITADLPINETTDLKLVNGSCNGEFFESQVAVYIDFNQNGSFADPGELAYSYGPTTGLNSIPVAGIFVPATATAGITGMRIIIEEGDSLPQPCGTYVFGETEDYTVNLFALPSCQDPPDPGTAAATPDSSCSSGFPLIVDLTLTGNSTGVGQTYQWEESTNGLDWNIISGATGISAQTTATTTTYYRCQVHCGSSTLPSEQDTVVEKAAPAGNTFNNPIVVSSFPYLVTGNNLSANCWTSDYADINPQASPDVYYEIQTDTVGSLLMSTCNTSDLNTYFHLLDGTGFHLNSLNNNGPLCDGIYASDSIYVSLENQVFYLVVEGNGTAEGFYELEINFLPDFPSAATEDAATMESFSIFPNPTTGNMNISATFYKNASGEAMVEIIDALGRVMRTERVGVTGGWLQHEITADKIIPDGWYHVRITMGAETLSKPIVLQR